MSPTIPKSIRHTMGNAAAVIVPLLLAGTFSYAVPMIIAYRANYGLAESFAEEMRVGFDTQEKSVADEGLNSEAKELDKELDKDTAGRAGVKTELEEYNEYRKDRGYDLLTQAELDAVIKQSDKGGLLMQDKAKKASISNATEVVEAKKASISNATQVVETKKASISDATEVVEAKKASISNATEVAAKEAAAELAESTLKIYTKEAAKAAALADAESLAEQEVANMSNNIFATSNSTQEVSAELVCTDERERPYMNPETKKWCCVYYEDYEYKCVDPKAQAYCYTFSCGSGAWNRGSSCPGPKSTCTFSSCCEAFTCSIGTSGATCASCQYRLTANNQCATCHSGHRLVLDSICEADRATCGTFECPDDKPFKKNKDTECWGAAASSCNPATCCEEATCTTEPFDCSREASNTENRGSGVKCTGNAATCNAATCCETPVTPTCATFDCSGVANNTGNRGSGVECTTACDADRCCEPCQEFQDCDDEGPECCSCCWKGQIRCGGCDIGEPYFTHTLGWARV